MAVSLRTFILVLLLASGVVIGCHVLFQKLKVPGYMSIQTSFFEVALQPQQKREAVVGPYDNVTIYVIMPTGRRQVQLSLITMQLQLFSRVPNLHLILVDDAEAKSKVMEKILANYNLVYTYMVCSTATLCKKVNCTEKKYSGYGSVQRNCGLTWLKQNNIQHGVIYFADDDNFYTLDLFQELRKTKKVALFPVGGFSLTWLSTPLIQDGVIKDFLDPQLKREWPIDMAGFSVSIKHWRSVGHPLFIYMHGYLETTFVEALKVKREDIDILADGAKKVYVWHNSIRKRVECFDKLPNITNPDKYHNYQILKEKLVLCNKQKR